MLANDTDVEGSPLTAVLVTGPATARVTLNADGSFTYTPRANYNGTASFTYRPSDGQAQARRRRCRLTVAPVNDAPVAPRRVHRGRGRHPDRPSAAGSPSTSRACGTGTHFTVSQNLTEFQQGVQAGSAGTLASFDLYIVSGPRPRCSTCSSTGAPRGSPDAPRVRHRADGHLGDINQWVTFDVSAANIQLAAGEWFTIGTRDGFGDSRLPGRLYADHGGDSYPGGRLMRNLRPWTAAAGAGPTSSSAPGCWPPAGCWPTTRTWTGNALSAVLVSGPAHGTLALAANGSFTYTPAANYNGPDSFTYKANDGTPTATWRQCRSP